jgi:hypothetical protein
LMDYVVENCWLVFFFFPNLECWLASFGSWCLLPFWSLHCIMLISH